MTEITIYQNSNKEYKGFRAAGHAGYAEAGNDIFCAAISVLITNTMNSIEVFTNDTFESMVEEDNGIMEFCFLDILSDKAVLLLDSMILGLTGIQENDYNNEYINLTFEEV